MPNDVRSELEELIKERDVLETEAAVIKDFLTSPGPGGAAPPGLGGVPLVDAEGFPRADIDVWDVRVKRNRLACIDTDHAELMKRIEELVQRLHQEAKTSAGVRGMSNNRSTSSSTGRDIGAPPHTHTEDSQAQTVSKPTACMDVENRSMEEGGGPSRQQPFAVIDQVFRASPAEEAGLENGDLLVSLGTVNAQNHNNFAAVVALVQENEGRVVRVEVQRPREGLAGGPSSAPRKETVVMSLIPHAWSGRGLLGCHLTAMSS
ncbi:hypothetical protein NSK_003922 [Nannochloropsis salina CCMP1776]|uniref:PDZ domain-containing protein n=1 Tax=Nannochloropsis salina CCMP1776 TaxID=1027361 RepID=A0A4D9D0J5_9STRA|nr:hypothetical protein NSK_003922 [Nannochloropsis salina CCMP1776]|eukprot:TFJ84890.1 hypothetical protein NSK_003922 [Nannochloropsis salina CCMP1776]